MKFRIIATGIALSLAASNVMAAAVCSLYASPKANEPNTYFCVPIRASDDVVPHTSSGTNDTTLRLFYAATELLQGGVRSPKVPAKLVCTFHNGLFKYTDDGKLTSRADYTVTKNSDTQITLDRLQGHDQHPMPLNKRFVSFTVSGAYGIPAYNEYLSCVAS